VCIIRTQDNKTQKSPEPKTSSNTSRKKGFRYLKKLTAEQEVMSKDRQNARQICHSCFNEAMKAEQMALSPVAGSN
jgi:ABC-type transporter MlaC component